ncbi:hypothetical protein [Nocardia sp. NPDC052566]|uniref:hypothetical protein n=1 Tax=Nocardia sp. NPDC052566 TaxID=3364330 RepID=UPI0037CB33EE
MNLLDMFDLLELLSDYFGRRADRRRRVAAMLLAGDGRQTEDDLCFHLISMSPRQIRRTLRWFTKRDWVIRTVDMPHPTTAVYRVTDAGRPYVEKLAAEDGTDASRRS